MFRRSITAALLALLALPLPRVFSEDKPEAPAAADSKPVKTVDVTLGELKLKVPETWKQGKPSSSLRLGEFAIPAAEGDKDAAELSIFNFGAGGGIAANVQRWIGQFQPDGRKVKLTQGNVEGGRYVFVDLIGTYNKPIGPPIAQKTEPAPGSRMLGVILGIEGKGLFFLKLAGPEKTVTAELDNIRIAIGGNRRMEEEFKLPE